VARGQLGKLGVVREELVQAVLDVEAGFDAVPEQLPPGRGEATALGRDADDGGGRLVGEGVLDCRDDRNAVKCLSRAGRVDDHDARIGRVADHPPRCLAVVRVAGATLSEYEIPLLGHPSLALLEEAGRRR
jgi:hypothetical protein